MPGIGRKPCVGISVLFLVSIGFVPVAHADAVVLLEEPYSYDGALAGAGHAAVYLSRVCAQSPVALRRCNPGEDGVVISRYARIGGYDWIAIPLLPYLYAVESPEDVPLYANPKLVAFLRDRYRRKYLEEIAPDAPGGATPKGDWYEMIGSSYDRTSYWFSIETSPEQDDALIAWLNSQPNRASFQLLTRNCANFVSDILNFYYPGSETRGSIGDLGTKTPKHVAKSLVRFSRQQSELEFNRFVIPQVPGSMKRSKPVRGVVESFFRAKKYVAALAVFHPLIAGGVAAAYVVGDRFDPAQNALVLNPDGEAEAPPSKEERRAYGNKLKSVTRSTKENGTTQDEASWKRFEEQSQPGVDGSGKPVLRGPYGRDVVEVGVARSELSSRNAPEELRRGLMLSVLTQTLRRSRAPGVSGAELAEDWKLYKAFDDAKQEEVTGRTDSGNLSESESRDSAVGSD